MGYVLKAVLSSAQHPEYGQITVPFPIPDEKYDRMIELLEPLEIGDALRQDCRVDELDSFYTVLNRLVGSLVNFDELDYLAKRLDSFDDGEAAQFQGMACKLGVSNIKDFINLTFCCQQATVITDFSDLDAIGRQHYMTMQGGGCRIEELERLDGRKFALDLILNHLEGRITPYGVVYDNGMKLEQLYDGRHFPCYHYQPNLLAVGLSSRQEPENTDQITWLLLPCSEQQLQRGIARSGVNIHDARIWYEDSLLPSEVEEVLEGQREDLFALNDMATAIAALSDLEQKKLTAVMEMAKPECAGEIRELAKNLELFEFAPKVRTPAEYGRYMIQDSGHYEYDPNLEEFYDYERYGKLRIVFNTCTQEYEEVIVTEEVYRTYCRTRWNIKDNDQSFFDHEIQTSGMIGSQDGAYENFREFIDAINTPEHIILEQIKKEALYQAISALPAADQALVQGLFFKGQSELDYAREIGVSQPAVHKRKVRILKSLKKLLEN